MKLNAVIKSILLALGITCLAVPTTLVFLWNPFEHEADFALSDFYTRAAQKQAQMRLSQEVVIVSVDHLSRREIVETASKVVENGASVVALDVFMNTEAEGDEALAATLCKIPSLVAPTALSEDFPYSVFDFVPSASQGYVELSTPSSDKTIRYFLAQNQEQYSFAATAVQRYNGKELPLGEKLISFAGMEFEELTPEDLEVAPERVKGKIAILGNVNEKTDSHPTPVGLLSGVYIHAFIAQTILDGSAPHQASDVIPYLLAFILCFLLVLMHNYLNNRRGKSDLANLVLRVAQFVLLLGIYYVGAWMFIRRNLYVDFSVVMLLVASASLVFDFIFGLRELFHVKKG